MREMKDSGVEWIGKIPRDWVVKRVGSYFSERKEPNSDELPLQPLQFRYGNIVPKTSIWEGEEASLTYMAYNIVDPNTIMINGLNLEFDFITQRVGLVEERGIITSVYLALDPSSEVVPRYCLYLFKSYDFCKVFHSLGSGMRKTLTYRELKKQPIILPTLHVQRRIADYLDAQCARIDRAIARQQEVIEKLKEYKLAVITEAVTKGLNPDVPMKDSGIEWIGEIPEHWNILKLKYTTSILRGKFNHRPRNDPDFYDGIYPFVQTGDVAQASKYLTAYSQTLNELGYSVSKEFPRGSIVMTIAANVGDVAILDFDACFPDSVVGFIPNNKIQAEILFFIFKAMKSQLTRNAIISTQLNLNIEIIKEEYIPVASIKEQFTIIQFLEEKCRKIELAISSKQSIIDKLIEYKKSLIYEVVTGKREV